MSTETIQTIIVWRTGSPVLCLPCSNWQGNQLSESVTQLLYDRHNDSTDIKRKEDHSGKAVVAGILEYIYPSGTVYMVIRLVSLDCTIYLLGVGVFAIEVEVSRLIDTCIYVHYLRLRHNTQDGHLNFHTIPELWIITIIIIIKLLSLVEVQCCFTSTETIQTIRDRECRTTTSAFTQLLNSVFSRICALMQSSIVTMCEKGYSLLLTLLVIFCPPCKWRFFSNISLYLHDEHLPLDIRIHLVTVPATASPWCSLLEGRTHFSSYQKVSRRKLFT